MHLINFIDSNIIPSSHNFTFGEETITHMNFMEILPLHFYIEKEITKIYGDTKCMIDASIAIIRCKYVTLYDT